MYEGVSVTAMWARYSSSISCFCSGVIVALPLLIIGFFFLTVGFLTLDPFDFRLVPAKQVYAFLLDPLSAGCMKASITGFVEDAAPATSLPLR